MTSYPVPFNMAIHTYEAAVAEVEYCRENADLTRWQYFQRLIATANGRYHFGQTNLNDAINAAGGLEVRPLNFRQWLDLVWGPAM